MNTYLPLFAIALTLMLFITCQSSPTSLPNTSPQTLVDDSTTTTSCGKTIITNIDKKHFNVSAIVVYDDYSLQINTVFLRDSVPSSEPRSFNPIPISQNLVFRHQDKVLHEYESPALKVKQKIYNNRTVEMLDNQLFSINIRLVTAL